MVIDLFKVLRQRYFTTEHKKQHKEKMNNRGMSLVEVIISITILSIVIVPTMHALTQAMSYNLKSRRRQEATLAGEGIMEAFKGYDLQTLQIMFGGTPPADYSGPEISSHGGGMIEYKIINPDGTEKIDKNYIYAEPAGSSATYSYSVDASGKYTFTIDNLLTDTGKIYNVEIAAVPDAAESIYTVTNMKAKGETACVECESSWNDTADVKTAALNDLKVNCSDFESYVNNKAGNETGHPEDNAENMSYSQLTANDVNEGNIVIDERIMEFDISSSSVLPKVTYKYHVSGVPYYVPLRSATGGVPDGYGGLTPVVETIIGRELKYLDRYPDATREFSFVYDTSLAVSGTDMSEVYLYYYPDYDVKDTIKINNYSGSAVNCYLIKQSSNRYSKANTSIKESGYNVNVEGSSDVTLYHNLRQNIGANNDNVPSPNITGCDEKNVTNVLDSTGNIKWTADAATKRTDKVLSYNVTLMIKDTDGNLITSMDSTMNEK